MKIKLMKLKIQWILMEYYKINIIEFLKKGSGIHIKPENKGKFTKYCKGKVTSECIARGKRSSDPAVRKRATFAANSRKWQHKNGGTFKYQQGGLFSKVGNFLSSDTGKSVISGISQLYNGIKNSAKVADYKNQDNQRIEAEYKSRLNNVGDVSQEAQSYIDYLKQQNPDVHYGTIDLGQIQQRLINQRRQQNKAQSDQWKQEQLNNQAETIQSIQGSGTNFSGIIDSIGGIASSILNKKQTNSQTTTNNGTTTMNNLDLNYNWNTNKFSSNSSSPLFTNNSSNFFK